MDKDLLQMAVKLATAQVKANAIIATQDPSLNPSYVESSTMIDVVAEYYDQLKKIEG